jgi:signal transduction histidine kinase
MNDENFTAWFIFPPPIFRSLTGLVLAVAVIQALEVFDIEIDRLIERLEIEQSLLEERERIGRELHDSTIQTIYTAGLLVESAHAKISQPEIAGPRLDRGMEVLNEAIAELRTYISGLQPVAGSISLVEGIRRIADDLRLAGPAEIHLEIDLPSANRLGPERIHHILSILREALTNAERHARAKNILISAREDGDILILKVEDDGNGYSSSQAGNGHGLQNMRERANLLGGQLRIDAQPGSGVRIELSTPRAGDL